MSGTADRHQARLWEGLRDPAAYAPRLVESVRALETHISQLFFAGGRVYKVKKPVAPGFLDYTTLAARRHFCTEEVRLNRRLAPDVYRGVVEIRELPEGRLRVGGDQGVVCEYAVEMEELPAEGLMDRRLERGEIDNAALDAIVDLLGRFHAEAPTGPGVDEHGSLSAVTRNVLENFQQLAPFATAEQAPPAEGLRVTSQGLLARLETRARRFLNERPELFAARVAQGRIRDGHGDLHAGNLCFTPGGLIAYDCIEFADRLRCGDVAADLAFLAMDLDLRCFRGFSGYLVYRYSQRSQDESMRELIRFYKEYRALVRAKVGALRGAGVRDDAPHASATRAAARLESQRYLHLALSYGLPPCLIALCGLPATGKSVLARALRRPFEAAVLRSDAVRHDLFPASAGGTLDAGRYDPAASERVYAELLTRSERLLAEGRTVLVDANFASAARRAPFRALAARQGRPFLLVHLSCSDAVIADRMAARAEDLHEVSEANFAVYRHLQARFEPPDECPPAERLELSGEDATGALVARILEHLAVAVPDIA